MGKEIDGKLKQLIDETGSNCSEEDLKALSQVSVKDLVKLWESIMAGDSKSRVFEKFKEQAVESMKKREKTKKEQKTYYEEVAKPYVDEERAKLEAIIDKYGEEQNKRSKQLSKVQEKLRDRKVQGNKPLAEAYSKERTAVKKAIETLRTLNRELVEAKEHLEELEKEEKELSSQHDDMKIRRLKARRDKYKESYMKKIKEYEAFIKNDVEDAEAEVKNATKKRIMVEQGKFDGVDTKNGGIDGLEEDDLIDEGLIDGDDMDGPPPPEDDDEFEAPPDLGDDMDAPPDLVESDDDLLDGDDLTEEERAKRLEELRAKHGGIDGLEEDDLLDEGLIDGDDMDGPPPPEDDLSDDGFDQIGDDMEDGQELFDENGDTITAAEAAARFGPNYRVAFDGDKNLVSDYYDVVTPDDMPEGDALFDENGKIMSYEEAYDRFGADFRTCFDEKGHLLPQFYNVTKESEMPKQPTLFDENGDPMTRAQAYARFGPNWRSCFDEEGNLLPEYYNVRSPSDMPDFQQLYDENGEKMTHGQARARFGANYQTCFDDYGQLLKEFYNVKKPSDMPKPPALFDENGKPMTLAEAFARFGPNWRSCFDEDGQLLPEFYDVRSTNDMPLFKSLFDEHDKQISHPQAASRFGPNYRICFDEDGKLLKEFYDVKKPSDMPKAPALYDENGDPMTLAQAYARFGPNWRSCFDEDGQLRPEFYDVKSPADMPTFRTLYDENGDEISHAQAASRFGPNYRVCFDGDGNLLKEYYGVTCPGDMPDGPTLYDENGKPMTLDEAFARFGPNFRTCFDGDGNLLREFYDVVCPEDMPDGPTLYDENGMPMTLAQAYARFGPNFRTCFDAKGNLLEEFYNVTSPDDLPDGPTLYDENGDPMTLAQAFARFGPNFRDCFGDDGQLLDQYYDVMSPDDMPEGGSLSNLKEMDDDEEEDEEIDSEAELELEDGDMFGVPENVKAMRAQDAYVHGHNPEMEEPALPEDVEVLPEEYIDENGKRRRRAPTRFDSNGNPIDGEGAEGEEEDEEEAKRRGAGSRGAPGKGRRRAPRVVPENSFDIKDLGTREYLKARFNVTKYDPKKKFLSKKERMWELDFFGNLFINMSRKGKVKKTMQPRNLIQLEKHVSDNKRLRLQFSGANHSYELLFSSNYARERFFECSAALRPSLYVWCPTLCKKGESKSKTELTGSFTTTNGANATAINGSCKVNVASKPYETFNIWCGTWNMAHKKAPKDPRQMRNWIPVNKYDFYALAVQESGYSKDQDKLISYMQSVLGSDYMVVSMITLANIQLVVLGRKRHLMKITNIKHDTIAAGHLNMMGNKGTVAFSMSINETNMLFVCSHFASNHGEATPDATNDACRSRNKNMQDVVNSLSVGRPDYDIYANFQYIFWMGDMNYRVELPFNKGLELANRGEVDELLKYEQLSICRKTNQVFGGFNENPIKFPPTYKYDYDSNQYSTSKKRTPSWVDRVLYRAWPGCNISCTKYDRCTQLTLSDHYPVSATFKVNTVRPYASIFCPVPKACHFDFDQVEIAGRSGNLVSKPIMLINAKFLENETSTAKIPGKVLNPKWEIKMIPKIVPNQSAKEYLRIQHFTLVIRDLGMKAGKDGSDNILGVAIVTLKESVDKSPEYVKFHEPLYCKGVQNGSISGNLRCVYSNEPLHKHLK